ncbi:hypothetical protein C1H46_019535 [Malus baccata]|uniref:Uncharacterized protein n=1 Tax=Malus baccata TaxID=106549 RepID=A0A540M7Y8_MALBA|nr:hypothetical protein C1H46_019535 [Malus baccata]
MWEERQIGEESGPPADAQPPSSSASTDATSNPPEAQPHSFCRNNRQPTRRSGESGGGGTIRAGEDTRALHTISQTNLAGEQIQGEQRRGLPAGVKNRGRPERKLGSDSSRGRERRRRREKKKHGNQPRPKPGPVPPEKSKIKRLTNSEKTLSEIFYEVKLLYEGLGNGKSAIEGNLTVEWYLVIGVFIIHWEYSAIAVEF